MKFAAYMTHTGDTVATMSRKLEVTKEAVRLWRLELRTPRPAQMAKITLLTGGLVTANDFALPVDFRAASQLSA